MSKYRLNGLYDDKALRKAAIYHAIKHDLNKPIFELDRNEILMYYRVVYSLHRVVYSEFEGFNNDLFVLEFAGVWLSKVASKMYKCIYGSIVKICKDIVYFFGKRKQ